ncbi:DUF4236 domain-containing protein [Youngiibacter fragilis]|uniref:DUF4236 domain-containing protein n=1 Tax=Youngiibacter fragilis 232.1 TaxID=994573 RepID=V7I5B6_9CLOT|nr:DUF4236 domain-containing protein [Youngiibacter fragilis]ETA80162.1 hypothetical protein T472_0213075 [Youngiibacter fragilis 232.1]
MGFRFRKSINLGKGFRLNVGKGSGSISFGGKGFRQSISTTGKATTTFGIPGTGLSYSKTFNPGKLIGKKDQLFRKAEGDTGLTPLQEISEFTEDIAAITGLHREADYPPNVDWNSVLDEEPPFAKGEDGPNTAAAKKLLEENKPGFLKRLFGGGQDTALFQKNVEEARLLDQELMEQWQMNKVIASKVLTKDTEGFIMALESLKMSEELGSFLKSLNMSFTDADTINVDAVLSITDFIPEEYKTLTPTGKLSIRKYTKTDYWSIAAQFVAGIAFRISRDLFNLFPIADCYINITEEDKNPYTGKKDSELILSVKIERSELDRIDLENADPFEALVNFHHEADFSKTKGFAKVSKVSV